MKCKCPHCGTKYEFDADGLGRIETCNVCGKEFAPENNKILGTLGKLEEMGKRQNDGSGCSAVFAKLFAVLICLGCLGRGSDMFLCGDPAGPWIVLMGAFLCFGWWAIYSILVARMRLDQEIGEVQKKASQYIVDRLANLSDNMEAQKRGLQYICDRLADICDNLEKK